MPQVRILLLPSSPHSFTFSETDFITHSPFLTNLFHTLSLFSEDDLYHRKEKLTDYLIFLRVYACILSSLLFNRDDFLPSIKPISTIFESIHSTAQESHTIYHSAFFLNIQYLSAILHISFKLQFFLITHLIIIRPQSQ